MKALMVIGVIIGGLLFIYFNVKITCKLNFTLYFLFIYVDLIFFKKVFTRIKKIDYFIIIDDIVDKSKNAETISRYRHYLKGYRYLRPSFKLFIINNISVYKECFQNTSSIAIEFNVVNRLKHILAD